MFRTQADKSVGISVAAVLRRRRHSVRLNILFAVTCCLSLASCGGDLAREAQRVRAEMEPYFDHAVHAPLQLRAEQVSDSDVLGIPVRILATADYLIVSDRASDPALHVFDRSSGRHLSSFGSRGGGPGEFTTSPEVSVLPNSEDLLYAFDGNQSRVVRIRLPEGGKAAFGARSVLQPPTTHVVYDLVMLLKIGLWGSVSFRRAGSDSSISPRSKRPS